MVKCKPDVRQRRLKFLLYGQSGELLFRVGRSVGKIILSFRISTSKNKDADHRVKETCAIWLIQVTYEAEHISLLRDSAMSNALNFCFYIFYCNLKEKDHTKRIIDSKTINIFLGNQYYYYFGLPKIRVGRARTTKVAFA